MVGRDGYHSVMSPVSTHSTSSAFRYRLNERNSSAGWQNSDGISVSDGHDTEGALGSSLSSAGAGSGSAAGAEKSRHLPVLSA